MKYAVIALALFAVVHAASEIGQFVPRAIYTLDSDGHQSAVHPVSARLLRRLRRQVFTSSSSSSSSSSSGDGIVHQQSTQSIQNPDGTSTYGSVVQHFQPTFEIGQRFGEDSPTSGYSTTSNTAGLGNAGYVGGTQGTIVTLTQTTDKQGNIKQHVQQSILDNRGKWTHKESNN